jgi:hypothetical protein
VLTDILAKGYFPAELPPCFTTGNFAAAIMASRAALPAGFNRPHVAQLGSYSLARAGNSRFRRRLSIVNPVNFYALSNLIVTNWRTIDLHLSSSQLSKSRPTHRPNSRRGLSPITYERRDLIPGQAKNRASARVLLVADIAEFYHSIYTHSIPWALHKKAFSKLNRGAGILGNDIDMLTRNSQYGQTVGIPIGPDTSLVIAECILAEVEELLRPKIPNLIGFRFVDDFELCFKDHSTAEHGLAVLQEQLLEFELRLNPRKTALHIPPISFEPEWIAELRRFKIRDTSGQRGDLVAYFDLITRFLLAYPSEHVSKYGIKRFTRFRPQPKNLNILQSLLCHVGVAEPGSIREVVESLFFLRDQGFQLDPQLTWETFNTVIANSAPLGYQYEVSWAMWGLISFNFTLDQRSVAALQSTGNSVVAILALDARQRGLAQNLDLTRWAARMTAQDLREEEWLLSYEANVRNWLPSVGGVDHVAVDRDFGFLKQRNVRFYVP